MNKSIFSRLRLLALLVAFVCTCTFIASCDHNQNESELQQGVSDTTIQKPKTEPQNPETNPSQDFLSSILGTWISQFNDGYTVTTNKVIYDDGGYGFGWEADLVEVTAEYIYAKKSAEEYIAISYKDLNAEACSFSNAYKAGGKTSTKTLEEAKTEFTIENGYYGYYGEYVKQ